MSCHQDVHWYLGNAVAVKHMSTCRTAVSPVVWRHLEAAWKQAAVDRMSKPKKGAKQQDSPSSAATAPADGLSERWEAASKLHACTAVQQRSMRAI